MSRDSINNYPYVVSLSIYPAYHYTPIALTSEYRGQEIVINKFWPYTGNKKREVVQTLGGKVVGKGGCSEHNPSITRYSKWIIVTVNTNSSYNFIWHPSGPSHTHQLSSSIQAACNLQVDGYRYTEDLLQLEKALTLADTDRLTAKWAKVTTPVNIQEWSKWLASFPYDRLAGFLLQGSSPGFK